MKLKYFFCFLIVGINFLVAQDVECTEDNIGCMDENGCDYDPNALCPGECSWNCYGCNDETACNYNANADVNLPQTLCVYTDLGCGCGLPASQPGYNCFGDCLVDEDEDGICDEIYGCTDPLAPNYQQEANIDNNSCENIIYGCTNPFAENFDELANTEDGSCELVGCMAEGALNYSESATIDSGDCVWLEPVIANTCNGRYLEKIYTEVEVETVTYSNEFGLVMDIYQGVGDTIVEDRPVIMWIHGGGWMGLPEFEGSFVYDSEQSQFVCNEMAQRGYLAVSVDYRLADPLQIFCNGLCDYFGDISPWSPWDQVDYVMDHAAKCFSDSKAAIRFLKKSFAEGNPYRLNPDNIYIGGHSAGGATVNHLLLEDEEDMTPDNYWTQYVNDNGGYYGESGNYGFSHDVAGGFNLSGAIPSLNSITEQDFDKLYISVHGEADNIVYYDYGPWPASIIPDAIFPFLTFAYPNMHGSGSIHNYMNSIGMENYHLSFQGDPFFTAGHAFNMWGPNGKYAMIDFVTTHIYNDLPCATGDIGCTDPQACNYDLTAINDDGSCSEIIGCTDIMSCNFNPDAGCDDGSCTGSAGCMDENAFNYDSNATCQGYSSCIEIIEGCTYLYANNYNELANTDDGSCEIPGCTDELASNFNFSSTIDNGSCYYNPECIQSSIEYISDCGSYTWYDEDIDTTGLYTPSFLNPISSDYEGQVVDMSNPTSLVVGKPTENENDGLVKIYTRDGDVWTQKGGDILGQGLDISGSGDQFGIGVAMGDVNTIAASSISSDFTYTVCGIPYWTLDCGIECFGFFPFITCIPYCFPQYNSNCNDETLYNKGIVNVYDWFEDEWVLKGESIWGTFEDDFSGEELDMPNSNTIAIGSSNTGLTSNGFTGNVRIYEFFDNNWIQKGDNIYGQIGGDEVGKGFSMGDKNTLAVCYSAQNLVKVFSWNGSEWVQMGQNIIVDEISQSVSMFNNSTLAVTGEIYTKVFEWNGIYWIPKGEPVLFTGGESVSMGGPNTLTVTRPQSVALFRYQDGEWVLKTQTYNNPGPVVMGNPNILAIPGQVFEYIPEINEDGCEEITILELTIDDPAISGCTNPLACNYDESAICDDGSCSEISGCTDPTACNYNPNAGCDDGSCSEIIGCADSSACNYNPNAGCDDGSCYNNDLGCGCDQPAAEQGYDCSGNCLTDTDGDGICDEFEILGCLDVSACNYDSDPTTDEDNSLCNYVDGICDACVNWIIIDNDADNDGVCDDDEVLGCTNNNACNYNEFATENDNTCYNNDLGCGCDQPAAEQGYDCSGNCLTDTDGDGICDEFEILGCLDVSACNYNSDPTTDEDNSLCNYVDGICDACVNWIIIDNDADNDGVCDDDEVLGCTDNNACNYNEFATENDESCDYLEPYLGIIDDIDFSIENCDLFSDQVSNPEAWPYAFGATGPWQQNSNLAQNFIININSLPTGGANYRVVKTVANGNWDVGPIMPLNLGFNSMSAEEVNFERIVRFAFSSGDIGFDSILLNGQEQSCNVYIYDCDNNCFNDLDGDGVCDELEIEGCTDPNSYNYNSSNTDEDGSCIEIIYGCTDNFALNTSEYANTDDGSCIYQCEIGTVYVSEAHLFDEYIELYNSGENDCSLQGLGLDYFGGFWQGFIFDDVIIQSGSYYLANNDMDNFPLPCGNGIGCNIYFGTPENSIEISGATFSFCSTNFDALGNSCLSSPSPGEENNSCLSEFSCNSISVSCNETYELSYNYNSVNNSYSFIGSENSNLMLNISGNSDSGNTNNIQVYNGDNEILNSFTGNFDNQVVYSSDNVISIYFESYYNGYTNEISVSCVPDNEIIGCTDLIACNYDSNATINYGCSYDSDQIDCSGNCINESYTLVLYDSYGDGWYSNVANTTHELIINGTSYGSEFSNNSFNNWGAFEYTYDICLDSDLCYIIDFIDNGDWENECSWRLFNESNQIVIESSDDINENQYYGISCNGCTDSTACNFNPLSLFNNGSCYNNDLGCGCDQPAIIQGYDCFGNCLSDSDSDGICDEFEILGCLDINACNYDPNPTTDEDNSLCNYIDGVCDSCINGIIIDNDADNDGVCDDDEILGCTDNNACNFSEDATENNNTCFYQAENYLNCDGNCFNDSDNDGICDEIEITGCTNPNAINFNNLATDDNNSCDFGPWGETPESDCIMTVAFSNDFTLTFGNESFSEGWIAVTDLNGNIYGTTFWSQGQNNSITISGSDLNNNGMENGEELNWIFYYNNSDFSTVPYYNFANGIFNCGNIEVLGSLSVEVFGCTNSDAINYNSDASMDDDSCDFGPWDEIPNTACNMTILIPGDANIIFEGEPIFEAWIGVTDEEGNICGSTFWTYGETNSIAAWEADESSFGFELGETLNWIISTTEGNVAGNASFSFGSNQYSCNGLAGVSSIDFGLGNFIQEIELSTGWNMWSTYIDPENTNIENVFSEISNNLLIVKDENGSVYWPLFGLNTLGNLTKGKGYQTKMANDEVLIIEGDLIPSDFSQTIPSGWSIMGYLHTTCNNATAMMSPLINQLIILKDEGGLVFWPTFNLNTLGDMCPDKGYQIKMTNESIYSFPSVARFGYSQTDIIEQTIYYDKAINTGNNMTIGIPIKAWNILPNIGDEIAAYDEIGNLVGSTTFDGNNIALTVWGDDSTTDIKDGLYNDEILNFKLWDSFENKEVTMFIMDWEIGNNKYKTDNINIASNILVNNSYDNQSSILYQNIPNPFNELTAIKFYIPERSIVNLTLQNIIGEKIKNIENRLFNSGEHEIILHSNDLSPGSYFINMKTKNYSKIKKITLTK